MPDPVFSMPLAFELCGKGTCGEAQISEKDKPGGKYNVAFCKQDGDKCGGKGCYCQLFRVKKKDKDKNIWDVVKLNEDHEDEDYDPDNYEYSCFCVMPILEGSVSVGGDTYAVRFLPCDSAGGCSMSKEVVQGLGAQDVKLKCEGKCEGDCKCTMFRLKMKKSKEEKDHKIKWNEKDAKWEFVPKEKNGVSRLDNYYYRCFCVK